MTTASWRSRTAYDYMYETVHLIFALPHVFAVTIVATIYGALKGWLEVHIGHILFAWLLMEIGRASCRERV